MVKRRNITGWIVEGRVHEVWFGKGQNVTGWIADVKRKSTKIPLFTTAVRVHGTHLIVWNLPKPLCWRYEWSRQRAERKQMTWAGTEHVYLDCGLTKHKEMDCERIEREVKDCGGIIRSGNKFSNLAFLYTVGWRQLTFNVRKTMLLRSIPRTAYPIW